MLIIIEYQKSFQLSSENFLAKPEAESSESVLYKKYKCMECLKEFHTKKIYETHREHHKNQSIRKKTFEVSSSHYLQSIKCHLIHIFIYRIQISLFNMWTNICDKTAFESPFIYAYR